MFIAHLSDPHLQTGPLAAEPAAGLHRALARVLALDPLPDCVIITGDLADQGEPAQYEQLSSIIGGFPVPLHLLAGNHDSPKALVETFAGSVQLGGGDCSRYVVDYPDASLVMLDSTLPANPAGRIGTDQLGWLDDQLGRRTDRPVLVCLHHPPIRIGVPFMDGMNLTDAAELAEVIGRHRQVVRVLAGHVHRPVTAAFAGTTACLAPSTYLQSELALRSDRPMGYVAEPTTFLLHWLDGDDCSTTSVAVSHAGGLIGRL